jgi:hypothetical protein
MGGRQDPGHDDKHPKPKEKVITLNANFIVRDQLIVPAAQYIIQKFLIGLIPRLEVFVGVPWMSILGLCG